MFFTEPTEQELQALLWPFTTNIAKDVLLSLTPRCMDVGTISRRCLTFPEGWDKNGSGNRNQDLLIAHGGSKAIVALLTSRTFATHWSSAEPSLQ